MEHAVPGCRRGSDGRSVVDGCPGKDAERSPRSLVKAQELAKDWEEDGGQDVEKEDNRDGLGYFVVVSVDNRGGSGDGAAPADG